MIMPMAPGQLDSVLYIWLEANIQAHPFINRSVWEELLGDVRAMLPSSTVYVYTENGALIGFVGLNGNHIEGLFVAKAFQGRGVGKALMSHCMALHPQLTLDVFVRNTRAVHFYQSLGFSVCGTQQNLQFSAPEYRMVWPS